MPPTPISYPSTKPLPFRINAAAVIAAAAALRSRELFAFQNQLSDAEKHLCGHARLALDGGKLLLTSPRSQQRYTCTRTECSCEGAQHRRYCWHRAAATIIRSVWDKQLPLVRCPYCLGPMLDTHTIGGERSVACLVCSHELPYGAVAALTLMPWQTQRPRRAAA